MSKPKTFTASDLMALELPDPRPAVRGLIPEGLTLLAGKPKTGKSWLALQIALAVAADETPLEFSGRG